MLDWNENIKRDGKKTLSLREEIWKRLQVICKHNKKYFLFN